MFSPKTQDQGTIVVAQQDYLPILADSFLVDRQSQGLSPETISFYRKKLHYFPSSCDGQAVTQIAHITPDLIRRFMLGLSETHNEGGLHACFDSGAPARQILA
jgi:site-specific recombinase XerD